MAVCYATTAILLGWWPWNLPVSIRLVGRYAKWEVLPLDVRAHTPPEP